MPHAKLGQLVILIVFAGCTTQSAKDRGAAKLNTARIDLQCQTEQLTGSIIRRVSLCTTKDDRDAEQLADEEIRRAAGDVAYGGPVKNK
jgi:hypothetical protein